MLTEQKNVIVNLSKYIIAGSNIVSFVNSNHVIGMKVTLGFRPSMVCIQSHDPVITFGLDSIVDDGFIVNAYCITGNVNAIYKFSYLCTK